jgi:hypothetical protein
MTLWRATSNQIIVILTLMVRSPNVKQTITWELLFIHMYCQLYIQYRRRHNKLLSFSQINGFAPNEWPGTAPSVSGILGRHITVTFHRFPELFSADLSFFVSWSLVYQAREPLIPVIFRFQFARVLPNTKGRLWRKAFPLLFL